MNKKYKKQYTCKYNKLHIISHFSGYKKAGTTRAVPAPYSDLFFYFLLYQNSLCDNKEL